MLRRWFAVTWLGVVYLGCTPIADVHGFEALSAGASGAAHTAGASGALGVSGAAGAAELTLANSPCDRDGARVCMPGKPSREPLQCTDGLWQPEAMCSDDQRCEVAAGPDVGRCVAIARECAGHALGEEFCDDRDEKIVRACTSEGVAALSRPCESQQHCVPKAGGVRCACVGGYIDQGAGCELATSCAVAAGGCDHLTMCSMDGGKPVCGDCPDGYVGTGLTGCTPLLKQLSVGGGELVPAFSPMTRSYHVRMPLLRQQLMLDPIAPEGARVEINGAMPSDSGTWLSPVLPLGEHPVRITVAAQGGMSSAYDLVLERTGMEEAYLKAHKPDVNDTFGISLSLSGNTLAIGATSEDGSSGGVNGDESSNGTTDSGAVYVFVRSGNKWTQEAYLKADMPTTSAWFGVSVALDGDTLFVGEPRSSPFLNTTAAPRPGIVYVFTRNAGVWTRQAMLQPKDVAAGDIFAYSMVLTRDTLAVGAPFESTGGRHSGAVYVAARTNSSVGEFTKLKPKEPLTDAQFGWSVAVDADTLLSGAHQDNRGSGGPGLTYVFTRDMSGWHELQTLRAPSPVDGSTFGWSVSVLGNTAAIGAPRASLLRADTPPGEVYLFERSAGRFNYASTLVAPSRTQSDFFGSQVKLAGELLLICASGDSSGARGLSGDPGRSDSPYSGAFYLYGRQDGQWARAAYGKASNRDSLDQFGETAAIDGDTLVVNGGIESSGDPNDPNDNSTTGAGAVYVFR